MIDCFQVALAILGPDRVGGRITDDVGLELSTSGYIANENWRVGEKRHINDVNILKIKRPKVDEENMLSDANVIGEHKPTHIFRCEREEEFADYMHEALLSFVETLDCPSVKPGSLKPNVALTALSMLCIAFSRYPQTNLSCRIFQQMYAWIPWICELVCLNL